MDRFERTFDVDAIEAESAASLGTMPPPPERPEPARVYVGPPLPPLPEPASVPIEIEDEDVPEPSEPTLPPSKSKVDTVLEKLDALLANRDLPMREVLDAHGKQQIALKHAELEAEHRIRERARWGEWLRGSLTWGLQGVVLLGVYVWGRPDTKEIVRFWLEWLQRGEM